MAVKRLRSLVFILLLAAIGVAGAAGVSATYRFIRDVHPRTVTRFLKQVEDEFRRRAKGSGDDYARGMIEYVQNHYPYENMPEHCDTVVAKELAAQRKRTLDAISASLGSDATPRPVAN
jgi:hypothetical protein